MHINNTKYPSFISSLLRSGGKAARDTAAAADSYHKVTAQEAKSMIDQGGVTIVDVRTQEEYDQGHVPGALLLPVETIGSTQPQALPDKKAALLVYCRSGQRSKNAAFKLVQMGYTHIYDFGGIIDWPYETQQGPTPPSDAHKS